MTILKFPGASSGPLSELGGKGLSLVKMANAWLPVPPGFVLTVSFFDTWIESLKATKEWERFVISSDEQLKESCDRLKARAGSLLFNREQAEQVVTALKDFPEGSLFAVRSSSPEEDLEGASFAGGYETVLGVVPSAIESAVLKAFSSCLDYRIAVYKRERGIDWRHPRIAVVIQQQIASEVAGVGFSLNPVTNNYDEAVINSNWGLGETVVSGTATPDTFIVDKVSLRQLGHTVGGKEASLWLLPDGGKEERSNYRSDDLTLSEGQSIALTMLLIRIEKLYGKPMDIEWAIAGGVIHMLQARPITTYVPLPPELVTEPGEKKRLYIDATISAQGLMKPLSVMSTSVLKTLATLIYRRDITLHRNPNWPVRAYATEGRIYLSASHALGMMGKEKFCNLFSNVDPLAAKAVSQVDEKTYRADWHPDTTFALWAIRRLPRLVSRTLRARMWPDRCHDESQAEMLRYIREARAIANQDLPMPEFAERVLGRTADLVFNYVVPLFAASRIVLERIKKVLGPEREHLVKRMEHSLPHNPTVEMGMALYDLSQLLPDQLTVDELADGIKERRLPESFLNAWDRFLDKYGHRCAGELDIASPRYRENPRLLLEQLAALRMSSTPEDNPRLRYERNLADRLAAYREVCDELGNGDPRKFRRFKLLYHVWETLGGYREAPKFFVILAIDLLRQRLIQEADLLVVAGRLRKPEQIFDLNLDNLRHEFADPGIDLAKVAARNREFIDRLARVPQLPAVIDSRGLILRPPAPPLIEGEASGVAVSAGVVRGPVKILHHPHEKPLNRGDILVARATDPGWTPLFVNAAGVVLEIGGLLQHGALVAREYGLPCVGGVACATTLWEDGTIVEVDGSAGIVRRVSS